MQLIDRYAYNNALRRVDPAQKGGLAVLTILLCLVLNRPAVGFLAVAWMLALTTLWARVPALVFGRVLLTEGLFLLFSVVGVALSVSLGQPAAAAAAWRIGPLWFSTSSEALDLALRLLSRALGCAAALNFLILTTPLTDLIELLRRLRVPETLIELMMIIYRAIYVLLESLQRMRTAQDARLGYRDARRAMQSTALLGSQLLLDAYRRSKRLQIALESRGLDGPLRVLPLDYTFDWRAWWFAGALAASLVLAGIV